MSCWGAAVEASAMSYVAPSPAGPRYARNHLHALTWWVPRPQFSDSINQLSCPESTQRQRRLS